MYHHKEAEVSEDLLPHNQLKDYIAYARSAVHPKLNQDSGQFLIESYLGLRDITRQSKDGMIKAYPRNLESLIRLSEAHAKLRFSETVDIEDVVEAVRLTKEALKHSYTDTHTGRIVDVALA